MKTLQGRDSFVSVHARALLVAVARTGVAQARTNGAAARALGVNTTGFQILSELALDGWLTNGQIAERLSMSTGGVTPALDRLENAGLLERIPNPADRRSSIVSLTERGRATVNRPTDLLDQRLGSIIGGLEDSDREVVLRFLLDVNDAQDAVRAELEE